MEEEKIYLYSGRRGRRYILERMVEEQVYCWSSGRGSIYIGGIVGEGAYK
jgi:hypothetical protein